MAHEPFKTAGPTFRLCKPPEVREDHIGVERVQPDIFPRTSDNISMHQRCLGIHWYITQLFLGDKIKNSFTDDSFLQTVINFSSQFSVNLVIIRLQEMGRVRRQEE